MERMKAFVFAAAASLTFLAPMVRADIDQPTIKVLVNQAGYNTERPKRILLQTNFEPAEIADFEVVRGDMTIGSGVWRGTRKIDAWGLWYRAGDLPAAPPGEYVVRVRWRGSLADSAPFRIEPRRLVKWTGPLATRFFYIQRCGCDVPGWHGPCHMDDARLVDGSHRDLAGGWHDAGDYNKYNGYTPLAVYALAKFAGSRAALAADWADGYPLPAEESAWGARWLEKCRDAADGKIIGQVFSGFGFWGRPEGETDNVPGTADDRAFYPLGWNENEMAVAAWAALYRATGDARWRNLALGLWEIVEAHDPGLDHAQRAKRLLAAIELYGGLTDERFKLAAERDAAYLLNLQDPNGSWPAGPMTIVDYGLLPAALAEFVRAFPKSPFGPPARDSLGRYLDFWETRKLGPFSVPKWSENDVFYPPSPGAWYVGQNSMYLSQAWAGATMAGVLGAQGPRARQWAAGCLDWVLGANPLGVCLMYGAGSVHLKQYHHRYDAIPNGRNGNVPGAIANGIVRRSMTEDAPYLDLEGNWWRTNEPWLPHNAYFLLALSELDAGQRPEPRVTTKSKSARETPAP
jgi:hypothetical protein